MRALGAAGLVLAAAGCVAPGGTGSEPVLGRNVEVEGVPFYPQTVHHCGPAALATVLTAAGRPTQPDALVERVYTPGLKGTLQLDLIGAVRDRGLVPYPIARTSAALERELGAGRPVLVLQNQRFSFWPAWHYAVVVGVDANRQRVVMRSGRTRRADVSLGWFLRTWNLAERWGLVVLEPGELPAAPDRERYLEAVAGLGAAGQTAAALRAYDAAVVTWPQDASARFARGNARHALGDLRGARRDYRAALAEDANYVPALNNLASMLGEMGCLRRARQLIERAWTHARPPWREAVAETRRELEGAPVDAAACKRLPAA